MPSPETTVNQLSLEHWALIANVYNNWPFKSDVSLRFTPSLAAVSLTFSRSIQILFDEAQFTQHD